MSLRLWGALFVRELAQRALRAQTRLLLSRARLLTAGTLALRRPRGLPELVVRAGENRVAEVIVGRRARAAAHLV